MKSMCLIEIFMVTSYSMVRLHLKYEKERLSRIGSGDRSWPPAGATCKDSSLGSTK